MNILMTTDTIGGVWNYSVELSRQLGGLGVQVFLATMGGRLSAAQRADASSIPNIKLCESTYKLCWMSEPWGEAAAAGRWLMKLAKEVNPELVHLNDFAHGILPWNCPVLMVGHSCVLSWFDAVRGQSAGNDWDRYREVVEDGLHAADWVIAPTQAMLTQLQKHYGPLGHGEVIFNGADPERYRPRTKQPYVLSAGRIWDEAKNFSVLMEAAPRIHWPIAVAGDSLHPEGGEALVRHLKGLGRLSSLEMAERYAEASIYVSAARYEPFGLSVLEAALSGCALVLADIQTLHEVWGETALYVPLDDPIAVAGAVNHLIENPEHRQVWAGRARAKALRLTSHRMAQAYHSRYRSLIEATPLKAVTRCAL